MVQQQRGFTTVAALALMATLVTLGLALTTLCVNGMRLSVGRRDAAMAFNLAEAGLNHALIRLRESRSYAGQSFTALGAGDFRVVVSTPTGRPDRRSVVSVGRVSSLGGPLERRVQAMIDIAGAPTIFDYAVITEGALMFSGNPSSHSTPVQGSGHVHSNTSISLSGNPAVNGVASAAGSITSSGSPSVSGGMRPNAARVAFPQMDTFTIKAQARARRVTNGNVDRSSNGTLTLRGLITGDLNISGNVAITLDGPVWVEGNINLSGNVTITGDLLITERVFNWSGNGTMAGSNRFTLVSLFGPSDQVAFNVSGNPSVVGTIATNRMDASGNFRVTRNSNYDPPTEVSDGVKIEFWHQL